MPAKDVIIGRVAVKVLPDVTGFKERLRADLEKIERTLKPVTVQLDLDSNGLSEKVDATVEEAKKTARSITLHVDLDGEKSVEAGIARLDRELEKLRETKIKVAIEKGDLEAAKGLLQERLAEVARVHLQVDPKSKSSMEHALHKLDNELDKFRLISIDVETNEESLRIARDNLQRELDIQAEVEVKAKNDIANKIQRDVNHALSQIKVNPKMDDKRVRQGLREIEKHLLKIEDLKLEIHPDMNERQKREVEHQIDELKDKVDNIKSSIEPDVSQPHRWMAQENLARLTRPRTVAIIPIVSKVASRRASQVLASLAGARAVTHVLDELWSSLKNLDKNVPLISSIALAIQGLGAMGLTTASNLFALSQSLAQIGPAALALPGIFGGLAIGVSAFAVAMKDFNKYFPAFAIGMGKAKSGIAWQKLQDSMSQRFWSRAAQPMREFIQTLFPQFAAGMNTVSSELGGFTAKLTTAFKGVFNGALAGMFRDLGNSIAVMSKYTGNMAQIIRVLGEVGAGYLPRLAKWFGDVLVRFDHFLTTAQKDGSLQDWIDTGIFMLKELGRAIAGLGSLLAGIARAANRAGGSTLTMLGDTLEKAAKVVNGPVFQKALTGTFRAAHKAISEITNIAGPAFRKFMLGLANELQRVLPIVGRTLGKAFKAIFDALDQPAVWRGVTAFFRGIEKGVEGLAPALPSVGKALGGILDVLGTLAATVGPVLGKVLQTLADALVQVLPALKPAIEALGGALLDAITKLAPLIPKVADGLVWLINQIAEHPYVAAAIAAGFGALALAFQAVAPIVGTLISALGPLASAILPAIGAALPELLPILIPVGAAFAAMAGAVAALVVGLAGALIKSPKLRDTFKDLWQNVLVPLGKEIWTQAKKHWPAIKQALSDVLDALVNFWITAQPYLQDFVDWCQKHMPEIKRVIAWAFIFIDGAIQAALLTLRLFIRYITFHMDTMGRLVHALDWVKQKIWDFASQVPSLFGVGQNLIGSLINGIVSTVPRLWKLLDNITLRIPLHKGPPAKDKKLLYSAGQLIIGGLVGGMQSKVPNVDKTLAALTKSIAVNTSGGNAARVDAAMASGGTPTMQRTLNYYAAPGHSLGSEDDLFAAADRARMVDW